MNSDVLDTLLWAKASYKSGTLFAPDFNYAAFLPFGGSLLMLPFIGLFGISYTTQIIGMVLFEAIFFVSLVLFAKKINFSANQIMIFLILMCSLWLCGDKFREMFCEHIIYYSLSVLFILIGYTLLSALVKSLKSGTKKKKITLSVITFIFFALVATDGFQIIFISTVPIIAGFCLERFFCLKTKLFSGNNSPEIIAVFIVLMATGVGFMALQCITQWTSIGYATGYSIYDSENAVNWVEKLRLFFVDYYQLFEVKFVNKPSLSDIKQIPALIRFAFSTMLLAGVPLAAVLYNKAHSKNFRRVFWTVTVVFAETVFLWFFGVISTAGWRLIPMITCLLILFVFDLTIIFKKPVYLRFNILIIAVAFLFSAVSVAGVLSIKRSNQKYGKYQNLINELETKEVYSGYSDFWVSAVVNTLSNEEITAQNVRLNENKLELYQYQQFNFDPNSVPSNKNCFLILSTNDVSAFEKSALFKNLSPYLTEKFDEGIDNWFVIYFYSCDIGCKLI